MTGGSIGVADVIGRHTPGEQKQKTQYHDVSYEQIALVHLSSFFRR
jgi:hypothetical protein